MKIYFKYFMSMCIHKYYMFKECFKMGMYLHAFIHDASKFLPSEFVSYAKFYLSEEFTSAHRKAKEGPLYFKYAWNKHQKRNPHHWPYWVLISDGRIEALPMPEKYVKQMVADWRAVGRYVGKDPYTYYLENKDKLILHKETKKLLMKYIGKQNNDANNGK